MKAIFTAALLTVLTAGAGAFELQTMDAAGIRASEGAAAPAPAGKAAVNNADTAYAIIKDYFNLGYTTYESDVPGTWEGRIFMRDPQGYLEPMPIEVTFTKKTLPSQLGPLFQEDKAETYVQFPYYEALLERRVTFDHKVGLSFQFQWEGLKTVTFRKMFRGNEPVLLMKSDCYTGDTYAYFMRKKPANKQAYTGPLPMGDLFGPLPPYYHGQLPPLQVNGVTVEGAYEYTNQIISYKDQAEALAVAEQAAAAIRAAGCEVLSVKAVELNGFYHTSVGFSGKKAILYHWDDDAPSAEEAAAILKRKTERYQSEGYTILETKITRATDRHFFFIVCAKFY